MNVSITAADQAAGLAMQIRGLTDTISRQAVELATLHRTLDEIEATIPDVLAQLDKAKKDGKG